MKSIILPYLFSATLLMTGCQTFQFVESPIPVKNAPSKSTLVKTINAIDVTDENIKL